MASMSKQVAQYLPCLTRFRLGKCLLNYYLYKLKLHRSGHCTTCNVDETILHYIFECPKQTNLQFTLPRLCTSLNIPCLQNTVFNNINCQHKIYATVVASGRRL